MSLVPFIASVLIFSPLIPHQVASLLGRWEGDSRCVGKLSACHDEHVLYQISATGAGHFTLDGSRIAGGDTVDMGPLSCTTVGGANALACPIPAGTWRFAIVGNQLEGTLTLTDSSVARHVNAHRAPRVKKE